MNVENVDGIIKSQREFFYSGRTLSVKFRIAALEKLRDTIKKYQTEIHAALMRDLGKSSFESYMCETGLVLSEISYMIKHVRKFAKEKRVRTPLSQFAAKSYIKPSPYGNILVMSPWNYPFLLTMEPAVDAIAAGNTVVVKPSAYSPATSAVIEKIFTECFSESFAAVLLGGRKENAELLNKKFDMIFFTGSQSVGKEVLRRAAENLTPVVLELGGKSPCIVEGSAKIELAAKRIVFGKYLNCGQTCVAPDYILCESSVKDRLVAEIKKQIKLQFGENPLSNPNYGKIVNEKHFARLKNLIDGKKPCFGGRSDARSLKIEPTVLDDVNFSDAVMQEEIFGPILPVLTFDEFEDVFALLRDKPKPLALYIFSENKKRIREILSSCEFGGGCVNDCVIHLATSELGFGGVGESGMGAYHGKAGFDAFSHEKSIVDKKTFVDLPIRYQPYEKGLFEKLLRFFLR